MTGLLFNIIICKWDRRKSFVNRIQRTNLVPQIRTKIHPQIVLITIIMLNKVNIRTSQTGYNFDDSIKKYHFLRDTFCANLRHLIRANGYTILGFVKKCKADGLKIDRSYIIQPSQTRRGHLNVLIVATFSEIFNVSASQLFDPDLPKYYVATQK